MLKNIGLLVLFPLVYWLLMGAELDELRKNFEEDKQKLAALKKAKLFQVDL